MHQEYAYPWNAPREAIASPYPTYEETRRRDQLIAALLHAQELLENSPCWYSLMLNVASVNWRKLTVQPVPMRT